LQQLRQHEGISVKALEFTILTAARSKEVLQAKWGEVDLDSKVWTIPAARMKGNPEHKVPLSPQAIELLRSLYTEDGNDYLFIGSTQPHLAKNAMQTTLRRIGHEQTVHGFRSSFSDWAHELTAHSNHTIEISLAHTVGNEAERAYRRGDMFNKRRQLMEAWGRYVTTAPRRATANNVTPIRSEAS
jgi:integrase